MAGTRPGPSSRIEPDVTSTRVNPARAGHRWREPRAGLDAIHTRPGSGSPASSRGRFRMGVRWEREASIHFVEIHV